MEYVLKCADLYYGLSIAELRKLAFQFAKKLNIPYPETWNENSMAGEKWYRLFIQRHPNMTLRTPQQVSLNRIRGFSRENVNSFFSNFDRVTDPNRGGFNYGAKKRKQNADKKAAKKAKQKKPVKSKPSSPQKKVTPSKKTNEASSSSSPSETDFCIICLQPMPTKLTRNNSIACNTCKRDVHLKCANIKNSYFTCVHCDSEFSEEEDA